MIKQVYLIKDKNKKNIMWTTNLNEAYKKCEKVNGILFMILEDMRIKK